MVTALMLDEPVDLWSHRIFAVTHPQASVSTSCAFTATFLGAIAFSSPAIPHACLCVELKLLRHCPGRDYLEFHRIAHRRF
jgi:hypothetical protein